MADVNLVIKAQISFVDYSRMLNWSVRYLIENNFGYNNKYTLFNIGDFLQRNRNTITIEDDTLYSRVTIKLYNKGVHKRDEAYGKEIGTKKQYLIKPGQFILSKIDARNGAFGIVPESLDGAITTADFLSYDIDANKINPYFLKLLTTTKQFLAYCQGASSGTTGRQRINEQSFLNAKIPIPSLEVQNKIAEAYNQKIQLAEKQEQQAKQLEQDIENYFFNILGIEKLKPKMKKTGMNFINYSKLSKWALSHVLKNNLIDIDCCKYPVAFLKDLIVSFGGGETPSKNRIDFWGGDISWTSPKDFKGYFIEGSQDHITKVAVAETGIKVFPPGIILSVFRSGILKHSFPTVITKMRTSINQDVKAYSLNENIINKYYYLYFVSVFKVYILKKSSKVSVTVESINTEDFLEVEIPIPPLKVQAEIADTIEKMKIKINMLQQQTKDNRSLAIEAFEKAIFQ